MKCKVEHVYKNIRYKILNINEDIYILDMGKYIWLFLFPFVFWFIPHKAYKIDNATFKRIQMPKNERMSVGSLALLGGGTSILFFHLLKPILYELNIHMMLGTKIFLLIIIVTLSIYIRLYIHMRLFHNLHKTVALEDLHTINMKIRPEKPEYYLIYVLAFILFWGIAFISCAFFLVEGNVIASITVVVSIILALMWNCQVIPVGTSKVKIIDG
ncbi:DUF443 family protein [Pseudogracilibacillus auburnensis]|uniref:Putative membrane protein (TIGR01218 family) n=1 Tax=Pseudogracilibacillus auburnensis TaxID=1494959 RepID=A0A2V3VZW4_9BACI|nr:DUF443 family protein [Pseudogracilibacillus auburnensis]MBO1002265.1 DUF443 family protein [Pseudogracilibacillus auburnensis]PXW86348.1 putative membrane protein (TIGR01218 family) [Pseudogracilibacillus auburnensis]